MVLNGLKVGIISQFLENARISRKLKNFQKMLELLENTRISRKCLNYQIMLELLENARISKKKRLNYQKMLENVLKKRF